MRCGCPTGLAFPHPSVPCIASLFLSRTRTGRLAFAFASSRHWLFPELLLLLLPLLLLLLLLCSSAAHEQALEPHHTSLHLPDFCSSSTPLPQPRHIPYFAIRRALILIARSLHSTCTGRDRQRVPPVLSQSSPTHHAPLCRLWPDIRQGPAVGSPFQLLSSLGALHSARSAPDGKGPLTYGTWCSLRGSADSLRT